MSSLSDKPKKLFVIKDRAARNLALRNDKGEVFVFQYKHKAKEARDEANQVYMNSLDDRHKILAAGHQARFYLSYGPDHKKFNGGAL